ncbi:cation:proton antiporter [Candidatus Woesearchaeota archaeon]|nr:cation:proton antiporter [Candidatus Woesearchaeota archaeon]
MDAHLLQDILFKLLIIVIAAKAGGWVFERLKQPAVLGELIIGVLLGPSLFGLINPFVEHGTVAFTTFEILTFLGEIGVILLLFQVGLESNIYQLLKAGLDSSLVAIIGVVVPVAAGFAFFKYVYLAPTLVSIVVGATLAATSVGITMRVLSEIKKVSSTEGKIILGAAVIDDIMGLIILSVIAGLAAGQASNLGFTIGKIILFTIIFLVGTLVIGIKFTPQIYAWAHRMKIKRTFVVSSFIFALLASFLAHLIGLATIVGAFAAGLVFERLEEKEHFERRIKPLADIFVPIFFVMAGVYLDIHSMNAGMLYVVGILTVIALIGKVVAGWGVVKAKASKLAIGVGMIPRGEVGLIFASFGITQGIIHSGTYSALVIVIMITTLITPPLLVQLMKSGKKDKKSKKKVDQIM